MRESVKHRLSKAHTDSLSGASANVPETYRVHSPTGHRSSTAFRWTPEKPTARDPARRRLPAHSCRFDDGSHVCQTGAPETRRPGTSRFLSQWRGLFDHGNDEEWRG